MSNQDLSNEKKWHLNDFYIDNSHWTSHPLFASRERHWTHNDIQTLRFYSLLVKLCKKNGYDLKANMKILFAPIGNGYEVRYLAGFRGQFYGVDISQEALDQCPGNLNLSIQDISKLDFKDETFDIVICSQFLHHVNNSMDIFLGEFHRVLKPNGILAILEPSRFYPLYWFFNLSRRFLGNVTGLVEDEMPINPAATISKIKQSKFKDIKCEGLLLSHVRMPTFLQHLLFIIDYPFRKIFPLKYFNNAIGIFGFKKSN